MADTLAQMAVEVLTTPVINQGLVRFLAPNDDHDARTEEIIGRINASGEAWFPVLQSINRFRKNSGSPHCLRSAISRNSSTCHRTSFPQQNRLQNPQAFRQTGLARPHKTRPSC